ncbi:MAG: hypothetical protein LJE84_06610 [Gammaproteobacteria bacterium]|nr:hypothetical protein [Gammaproteobacteria bacterium]
MNENGNEQARTFLDQIDLDRDAELAEVAAQLALQSREVRLAAYSRSTSAHREQAEHARARLLHRHDRKVSRARAVARRRSWQLVGAKSDVAVQRLMERARAAWADPDSQWSWCRYWVERARELAAGEELSIRIGQGGLPGTLARLKQEFPEMPQFRMDTDLSAGLVARFGEWILDARLAAHCPLSEQRIAGVLDGWMEGADG